MIYKLIYNRISPSYFEYDTENHKIYHNQSKLSERVNTKNNNHFFVFKIKNSKFKSGYQRIHISLSKIEYAIEKGIEDISNLEDYQCVVYDDFGNRYVIEDLSSYQSFKSCKGKSPIIDIDKEIWKKYNDYYFISNFGRVKNIFNREINRKIDQNGYNTVRINGKYKRVCRLVLEVFRPIKDFERFEANHLNYERSDDRLENLEWTTRQENLKHSLYNPKSSRYIYRNKK